MITERTEYYLWLCRLIKDRRHHHYNNMTKILHDIPYTWTVPNDDNRDGDGRALRGRFCDEEGIEFNIINLYEPPASILEMLVALACRMDDQLYDLKAPRPYLWFWKLIENLGLDRFSDDRWRRGSEGEIREIVRIFVDRKYDDYGHGGIFPLRKKPRNNQTKVEIWYQMMAYFEENYPD